MAVKLGEAVVYLLGDKKGIEDDLKDTEQKTGNWAQNLAGKVQGFLGGALKVGVMGAAAAVVGIGAAAFSAGMQMDEAMDTIAISTGATGEALDGLGADFKAVFTSIPTEAGPAADTISELNKRLGLTGESLQETAKPLLEMTRLLGGDAKNNTALFTRVMGDWSIKNEDAGGTLDKIFKASQLTGVGVESLMQKVVAFGSPLRLMGFSLDESIAMFGKWEKEGVNAELVMGSLKIAAAKFADAGVPLQQGLQDTITKIKGMTSSSEALSLGMKVFGARAGPDMVAAIREGRFEIGDLVTALDGAEGAIMGAADATADFPEQMQKFKNVATTVLAPLGAALMGVATQLLTILGPAVLQVAAWAGPAFESLGTAVSMVFDVLRGTGGDIPWEDIVPSWLAPIAYQISDAFRLVGEAAGSLFGAFRNILEGDIETAFEYLVEVVGYLGSAFGLTNEVIEPVIEAVWGFGESIMGMAGSLGGATGQVTGISSALAGMATPVAGLGTVFKTAFGIISSLVSQLAPIFMNIFVVQMQTALSVATTVWGTIGNIIKMVVPTIITLLGMVAERAIPVLVTAFQTISTIVSDVAAFVVPLVQQFAQLIQEQFARVVVWVDENMPLIQATMDAVFNGIKVGLGILLTVWNTVWPVMQVVVTTAFDIIKVAVETVMGVLLGIIKLGMQLITGDWEGAWETFKGILTTATSGVLKIVQTLFEDIGKAVGGKVGEFLTMGADLVGGLVKGIQDNAGKVLDAVLNAVKGGVDAVKSFFGIKSPSRLMMTIGEDLMGGLTIGIETEGVNAVAAMKTVVVDLAKMLKDLASAFHQMNKVEKTEGGLPNLQVWAEALYQAIVLFSRAIANAAAEVRGKVLSKAMALSDDLEQIWEMVKGFGGLLRDLAGIETIPDVGPFATVLQQAVILLTLAINNAATALGGKAIEAAALLSSSMVDILELIGPAVQNITALAQATVEDLAGAGAKWLQVEAAMFYIIGRLVSIVAGIDQSGYPAAVSFAESGGSMMSMVEPTVRAITTLAAAAIEDLQGAGAKWLLIEAAMFYIISRLVAISKNIDQTGYPAAVAFAQSGGAIMGQVEPTINGVTALAGVKMEDVAGASGKWLHVEAVLFFIAERVKGLAVRLGGETVKAAETFRTVTGDILDGVRDGLGTLADIGGAASTESVVGVLDSFAQGVAKAMTSAVDALKAGLVKIADLLRPFPAQIRQIFGQIDWDSVGGSIVEGIAVGIAREAGRIIRAAQLAARQALEAAKEELGIASPSERARKEVGAQIGLGMALGMEDMLPRVRAAMNSLGQPIVSVGGTGGMVDLNNTEGLLGQILANMRALVAGVQALQPVPVVDATTLARQLEFEARVSR